jgi:tryptophan synthase alpha chain
MSRVSEVFAKRKALITYLTAGDPSLAVTEKLVLEMEKVGADIVELGIPFSDPLADGPVIQASHQRALKQNVSLADVFRLVARLRKKTQIPLCFMLSYNLVVQYGEEKFYADCEKFGVDGAIIPDLTPEEYALSSMQYAVDNVFLVAPTSTDERIKLAASKSSGFVYLVSVAGITGKRQALASDLAELVARVKRHTKLPVAIGFGISTPAQAREAAQVADGVIVGSAIVDLIGKRKIKQALKLVSALKKAISGAAR